MEHFAGGLQKGIIGSGALQRIARHYGRGCQLMIDEGGIYIVALGVFHHGVAIGGGNKIVKFVAMPHDFESGAVGLCDGHRIGICRHGIGTHQRQSTEQN